MTASDSNPIRRCSDDVSRYDVDHAFYAEASAQLTDDGFVVLGNAVHDDVEHTYMRVLCDSRIPMVAVLYSLREPMSSNATYVNAIDCLTTVDGSVDVQTLNAPLPLVELPPQVKRELMPPGSPVREVVRAHIERLEAYAGRPMSAPADLEAACDALWEAERRRWKGLDDDETSHGSDEPWLDIEVVRGSLPADAAASLADACGGTSFLLSGVRTIRVPLDRFDYDSAMASLGDAGVQAVVLVFWGSEERTSSIFMRAPSNWAFIQALAGLRRAFCDVAVRLELQERPGTPTARAISEALEGPLSGDFGGAIRSLAARSKLTRQELASRELSAAIERLDLGLDPRDENLAEKLGLYRDLGDGIWMLDVSRQEYRDAAAAVDMLLNSASPATDLAELVGALRHAGDDGAAQIMFLWERLTMVCETVRQDADAKERLPIDELDLVLQQAIRATGVQRLHAAITALCILAEVRTTPRCTALAPIGMLLSDDESLQSAAADSLATYYRGTAEKLVPWGPDFAAFDAFMQGVLGALLHTGVIDEVTAHVMRQWSGMVPMSEAANPSGQ